MATNRKLMGIGPAAAWPFPTGFAPSDEVDAPSAWATVTVRPAPSSGVRKNKQTINEFLLFTLGMTLTNRTWAWDGYDAHTVVMKLWEVRKFDDPDGTVRIEVYAPPPYETESKNGRNERRGHVDQLLAGRETYAVLRGGSGRKNGDANVFDPDHLYKLSTVVADERGFEFGIVERIVTVDEFLNRPTVLEQDLADIERRHADKPTTRLTLVEARIGQGAYRDGLLDAWDGMCAVTGCTFSPLLRASHAKPWKISTDKERLNPSNGLPLTANLDALFDVGFIGFDASGAMLVSPAFPIEHHALLDLPTRLRKKPTKEQARFLAEHYQHVFKKNV
jgi:hypothetical protein